MITNSWANYDYGVIINYDLNSSECLGDYLEVSAGKY